MSVASSLVTLAFTEHIAVLLKRAASELGLGPQVRGQEGVGVGDGDESSLERVLERLGRTGGGGVDVIDTSQLQQALDGWRSDQTGATRGRDQLYKVSFRALRVGEWCLCLPSR